MTPIESRSAPGVCPSPPGVTTGVTLGGGVPARFAQRWPNSLGQEWQ